MLSIHKNTVNTTARRHKHNTTMLSKEILVQSLPPTIKKSKNIEHKRNITEKWTVQDTGVVKEEVLWKTGTVFHKENENKINVRTRTNFSRGTLSTLSSLQTKSTLNHREYFSDSSIKSEINESKEKKTFLTTPISISTTNREKLPKLQIQLNTTTPKNPSYTQNYQHFPTFGRKITFYGENYTEAPLPTTPTTTENIEKLERDLFAALDELAKKYSKENPV